MAAGASPGSCSLWVRPVSSPLRLTRNVIITPVSARSSTWPCIIHVPGRTERPDVDCLGA